MRRSHAVRLISGAVVLVLLAVAVIAATRPTYQATQVGSPLLGKSAPKVAGVDLAGAPASLAADRGHYVYVNFFASWCPPCQSEEPALVDFSYRQHRARDGALLLGVVFNDSVAAAHRFVLQWGDTWPIVPDQGGGIANSFGVESPPMTFLVDPHGTVAGVWQGPVRASQLEAMLSAAKSAHA